MKENADKHLDDLSRKVIGKSAIESPSVDFTKSIMSQIKAVEVSKTTTYVPLISKRIWLFVTLGVFSAIGYVFFGSSTTQSKWLEYLNLNNYVGDLFKDAFFGFDVSQTLFYSILLFGIMLLIQIPILKYQLNKRFE